MKSLLQLLLTGALLLLSSAGVGAMNEHPDTQRETLLQVIRDISERYSVHFTYDREIVEDVEVKGYDPEAYVNVDDALTNVLKNTKLKYVMLEMKYVIIYQDDKEGMKSLEQIINVLQKIIAQKKEERSLSSLHLLESTTDLSRIHLEKHRVVLNISGTVTDQSGEPLIGVNIQVKGSNNGTATDFDGNFELDDVNENATLLFSYVGYQTQEFLLNGQQKINIIMVEDTHMLDEVVVVGYKNQDKRSLTSSVSTMKGDEIQNIPVGDLSNTIGGRLSGIITQQTSGEPGNDESNMLIRGISTIGSTKPLLIVNGIPRDFKQLDPNTVKSVTVLKDAAAVAQYGVAGANGVILVTTKEGTPGELAITYNGYMGFQNPTAKLKIANSYQYAELKNRAAVNEGKPKPYSEFELQKYKDGSDPDIYPPYFDPFGEISRKNAPITNHSLNISGGTNELNYYMNIGYLNQQGMWKTTNFNRYNLNLNINAKASKTTHINLAFNGNLQNSRIPATDQPDRGAERIFSLLQYSDIGYQTGPMFYSNGLHGTFTSAAIFGSGYNNRQTTSLFSQLTVKQQLPFLKGLELNGTIAFDPSFENSKIWQLPMHVYKIDTAQSPYVFQDGIFGAREPRLGVNWEKYNQLTLQASLNYDKSFEDHNINAIGVFEAKRDITQHLGASRRNYSIDIDEINLGSSSSQDMNTFGSSFENRQIGLVYNISYDYKSKYIISTSGRYDGHYYFSPDNRYGFFPAFSLGWRISDEKFFKGKFSWIDDLKIRGSYGEVGALAGNAFQYLSAFELFGPGYAYGDKRVQIAEQNIEANPNITWEKAKKTNIGLDFSIWKNNINIQLDYFYEKRSNMLVSPNVVTPLEYGINLSEINAGVMENRGLEVSAGLDYKVSQDLGIVIDGSFTYAKNKVLEIFENPETYNNPNRRRTGRPIGTQFGYEAIGYFSEADFDTEGNLMNGIAVQPWGKIRPGDIRYRDVNSDGIIDQDDILSIGDPSTPGIIFGFSPMLTYKKFSMKLFFQGAGLRSQYFNKWSVLPFYGGRVAYTYNYDYWTPENKEALFPLITTSPNENTKQKSSHWMKNGNYIRLKNISLSYDMTNLLKFSTGMQVYITGSNLFTWSNTLKYGYDPENTNEVGRYYMHQKILSLGFVITL